MKLDKDDIAIEEVLYRYFRNELSDSEAAEVDAWRNEAESNEITFQDRRILFMDMKGLSYYENLGNHSVENSWENFRDTNKVEPIRSINYLRYAASIAVILSAVIGVYLYQNQPKEISLAEITQVQDVTLADGSNISLNEGAELRYTEPFQNNERRVQLDGEAYFDIAKDPDMPFVIDVEDVEVRVLGTKFFVNNNDQNKVSVEVEEGKVLVSYSELHQIVEGGNSIVVDMEENEMVELEKEESGIDTFWKTRKLVFNETSLEEVTSVINSAYKSSISLEGATDNCLLTVTFENESLENILEVVSSTLNYEVINDQGSIILKGNGCD